jgi:hypothetical protein
MTVRRSLKSKKMQVVDTRSHALTVFDGAVMVGSLVERAGRSDAYDIDGRHLGTFNDLCGATRAIPRGVAS